MLVVSVMASVAAASCGSSASTKAVSLDGRPYCFLQLNTSQKAQIAAAARGGNDLSERFCVVDDQFNEHYYTFGSTSVYRYYGLLARQAGVLNGNNFGGQLTAYEEVMAQTLVASDQVGNLYRVYRHSGSNWIRAQQPLSHKVASISNTPSGKGKPFAQESGPFSFNKLAPFSGKIVVYKMGADGRLTTSTEAYSGPSAARS